LARHLLDGETEDDPAALSLCARYNITDQGSDSNYWLFSLGFVFLNW